MNTANHSLKKPLLASMIAIVAVLLCLPAQVVAYNYNFQGTVLYDSQVGSSQDAGYGQNFTGSFSTENGGSLSFNRADGQNNYQQPDSGDMMWGNFTQDSVDYVYAYIKNNNNPDIKMGAIWWNAPKTITTYGTSRQIFGVAFHLEGDEFAIGNDIVQRLENYLNTGIYTDIAESVPLTGCSLVSGNAFLGVFTDKQVLDNNKNTSSEVPLPSTIWFLGSGLLALWRRKRNLTNY